MPESKHWNFLAEIPLSVKGGDLLKSLGAFEIPCMQFQGNIVLKSLVDHFLERSKELSLNPSPFLFPNKFLCTAILKQSDLLMCKHTEAHTQALVCVNLF